MIAQYANPLAQEFLKSFTYKKKRRKLESKKRVCERKRKRVRKRGGREGEGGGEKAEAVHPLQGSLRCVSLPNS